MKRHLWCCAFTSQFAQGSFFLFFFFFRVGDKVGSLHTKLHDIHESLSRDFEEIVVEASACN